MNDNDKERVVVEITHRLMEQYGGDQVLVHATKGLETESFSRMSEVLREEACSLKLGTISGPNLALEVMKGNPAGGRRWEKRLFEATWWALLDLNQ